VYQAIKAAVPETRVVGIGGEYGAQCIENILGAIRIAGTNSMDAWSIHPYRYPHSPESSDLNGEMKRTQEKVAGTGERSQTWVTEIGYPTHRGNGGSDEAAQARYLVRTLGLLHSMGGVEKTFWYDFKDDGVNREYNENNFGLIHHESYNCAPKPGMVAASAYVHMTGGAECKRIDRLKSLYVITYQKQDGTQVVLVWSIYGLRAITVIGEDILAYNFLGASVSVDASRMVLVTEDPVYVTGRKVEVVPRR
jgi:hypothetical protein